MKLPDPTSRSTIRNQIKIDDVTFEIVSGQVQLSIGSHARIDIKLDIKSHPAYYDYFIKKYESSIKFDIFHRNFVAKGTYIVSMDITFDDEVNLYLKCDLLLEEDEAQRRDIIIGEILKDQTLPDDSDITT
jgi:hypothetical protein